MAEFDWFGGSGNLAHTAKWDEPNGVPQLPGSGDLADMRGAGTLTGSLDTTTVLMLGDFVLQGAIITSGLSLAWGGSNGDGGNGSLTFEGSLTGGLGIGGGLLNGCVTVGSVDVTGLGAQVIATSGSNPAVSLGNGSLTVENQGAVTTNNLAVGTAQGGNGALTVESGGVVTTAAFGIAAAGATGTADITGQGSQVNATMGSNASVGVGYQGVGSLTVEEQGAVTTVSMAVGEYQGASGTLTVETGGVITGGLAIGNSAGATGTVDVTGQGSQVDAASGSNPYVTVGYQGVGSLTIENQGALTTEAMAVGEFQGGAGTLTVESGGIVTMNGFGIGNATGATGSADITGLGSLVSVTSGSNPYVSVGYQGTGSLTVENQGALTTFSLNVADQGGTGTVTVNGGQVNTANIGAGNSAGSTGKIVLMRSALR